VVVLEYKYDFHNVEDPEPFTQALGDSGTLTRHFQCLQNLAPVPPKASELYIGTSGVFRTVCGRFKTLENPALLLLDAP
jgi:hypothetical protein